METNGFEYMNLCPEILRAVKEMGFEEMSPIQAKAIPAMLSGKDIIGQAQTVPVKRQPLAYHFYKS